MLRSMYARISAVFRTNLRRQPPRRARPRRLTMEGLECRRLMTATTLTMNSISDGSFEAPALAANTYQVAPASSPWTFSGDSGVTGNASGIHRRQSQRARRQPGRLPQRQRQHQPNRVSGRRRLQPFLPGRPACRLPDPEPGNRGPDRWRASRPDRSRQHRLCSVPIGKFHGRDGHARRRAPRLEPAQWRQHGLYRRSGDHAGGRFAPRWRFRAAGPGRKYARDRSRQHSLAVLGNGRRGQ